MDQADRDAIEAGYDPLCDGCGDRHGSGECPSEGQADPS